MISVVVTRLWVVLGVCYFYQALPLNCLPLGIIRNQISCHNDVSSSTPWILLTMIGVVCVDWVWLVFGCVVSIKVQWSVVRSLDCLPLGIVRGQKPCSIIVLLNTRYG